MKAFNDSLRLNVSFRYPFPVPFREKARGGKIPTIDQVDILEILLISNVQWVAILL